MSRNGRSAGGAAIALDAIGVVLGLAALGYSILSAASVVLGGAVAGACWLSVLVRRRRRDERDVSRLEDAAVAGAGAALLLYALVTSASVLATAGVLALLWIGVNVARIERHHRTGGSSR